MPKSSKKGRLNGAQRKAINQSAVQEALDEPEGVIFGRVVRHLGMGNIEVVLIDQKRGLAKIRTVLSRKGATPISTNSIVILSKREFESDADTRMRFDVLGVMTKAEASKLQRGGHLPEWFIQSDEIGECKDDGVEFDYSEVKEEPEDDDADVDIDDI